MNTLIKLEKALAKRQLTMQISQDEDGNWSVVVDGGGRTTGTIGNAPLESTVDEVLRRWDENLGAEPANITALQLPDDSPKHSDLPGHEHCGQPYCTLCRAPHDPKADTGWLTCVRHLCPSCVAAAEQGERAEKHPVKYFLKLGYPVTIYEHYEQGLPAGFVAECVDLSGTAVEEDTIKETYDAAKEAAKLWIETAAATGQRIPLPSPAPQDRFKFPKRQKDDFDE